jgi:hypothetical protein
VVTSVDSLRLSCTVGHRVVAQCTTNTFLRTINWGVHVPVMKVDVQGKATARRDITLHCPTTMFSSNSRPLPLRTHSINAVKHANYFGSIDEELRDCKRVHLQGQEEDLREALGRMLARVEEMVRYRPDHTDALRCAQCSTDRRPTSLRRSNRPIKKPRILRHRSRLPNRISRSRLRITRCSKTR